MYRIVFAIDGSGDAENNMKHSRSIDHVPL
jgi:hypothetical protein